MDGCTDILSRFSSESSEMTRLDKGEHGPGGYLPSKQKEDKPSR